MSYRKLLLSIVLIVAVASAVGIGAWTLLASSSTPAEAGPCVCPKVYAPVVCDNGKTYPNQCVADCRHAKNCEPTGGI